MISICISNLSESIYNKDLVILQNLYSNQMIDLVWRYRRLKTINIIFNISIYNTIRSIISWLVVLIFFDQFYSIIKSFGSLSSDYRWSSARIVFDQVFDPIIFSSLCKCNIGFSHDLITFFSKFLYEKILIERYFLSKNIN